MEATLAKLLAKLSEGPHRPTFITFFQDSTGNIKSLPQEVIKMMLHYYTTLYAHNPIDHSSARSFLDKLNLAKISPSKLKHLNSSISISELSNASKHLAIRPQVPMVSRGDF